MKSILWAAMAVLAVVFAAQAEDCGKLISYGTIPLIQIPGDQREYVPVEIAGVPRLMLLDTGASRTTMTAAAAKELHLSVVRTDAPYYDLAGEKAGFLTHAPMKLGTLHGDDVAFWVNPAQPNHFHDPRIAGQLGYDLLKHFDVALDFGAGTLTLFYPFHCDGRVVYWPERPVIAIPWHLKKVPIRVKDRTLFVFPITIDGSETMAMLNTGADVSTMEKSKAQGKFDLELGSPDAPALADHQLIGYEVGSIDLAALGGKETTIVKPAETNPTEPPAAPAKSWYFSRAKAPKWTHRFKTISFAGITVNNPEVRIVPNSETHPDIAPATGSMLDRLAVSPDKQEQVMLLGMNVLRFFRIYVARNEQMIYISPASNQPVPVTPAAAIAPK